MSVAKRPESSAPMAGHSQDVASRTDADPLLIPTGDLWFSLLAGLVGSVAIVLRLVALDRIPAELYGDIAIVYDYLQDIRARHWPTAFVLSAGPLYHYLIMPVISIPGLTFLGIKLASVVVSLFVLLALYLLGREVLNRDLGLLAAAIGAISSWLLIFSRLGNSQIVVPLLSTLACMLAARVARLGRNRDVVGCALVSALGWYTYPQTFVLPAVMFVTLLCLVLTRTQVRAKHLGLFVYVNVPWVIPFGFIVARDPANFFSGYIGGKLEAGGNTIKTLLGNVEHALLAFNVRGDVVFRSNPAQLPNLDVISGVLFLIGLVYWLWPGRWRLSPVLIVPFLLLQVPSMLVLRYPDEVPSASRTLGVAPLAYLFVASGLWWLATLFRRWPGGARVLVVVALGWILLLNTQRYFKTYAAGLPDHNTPFGRIIAEYIDGLPRTTQVLVAGCCWSSGAQPEPKSILYTMTVPHQVRFIDVDQLSCATLDLFPRPLVMIWAPRNGLPSPAIRQCAKRFSPSLHVHPVGGPVFRSSPVGP